MCGLCSHDPKEREQAQEHCAMFARDLRRMAEISESFATGFHKPHMGDSWAKEMQALARALIRELVNEWM